MKPSLWKSVWNPRMLICVLVGFSSGLPLYFLMQFVPNWLRRSDIDLKTIGFIGLVQLPYAWKFIWAPFADRFSIFGMGRRRGWMLLTQFLLFLTMAGLGYLNPQVSLSLIIGVCLLLAFFSASQDIVIDALRRDILPDPELGLGTTLSVNAYRVAGLIPAGLGFYLTDAFVQGDFGTVFSETQSWRLTFFIMALFMLPGILCTFVISEPAVKAGAPRTLRSAVIEPFSEFINRSGVRSAALVLSFMFLYKFGDTLATALITPFYIDLGFSNTELAVVAKMVGFWSMIIGGLLGGLIMLKIGVYRSLWVFGVVQMVSILGFAVLSEAGKNIWVLGYAVGFEYLGVGLGTAAFSAYIATQSRKQFSATQLALFTSFFALPRSVTGILAGLLVEGGFGFQGVGWTQFFMICFLTAIPGMVLLYWVAPWNGDSTLDASVSGNQEK